MIYPRLVNYPEHWILFQPAQRFTALMDDVITHDKRDAFCPAVGRSKVFQQADKQHRTFTAAAHVADLPGAAVQGTLR